MVLEYEDKVGAYNPARTDIGEENLDLQIAIIEDSSTENIPYSRDAVIFGDQYNFSGFPEESESLEREDLIFQEVDRVSNSSEKTEDLVDIMVSGNFCCWNGI